MADAPKRPKPTIVAILSLFVSILSFSVTAFPAFAEKLVSVGEQLMCRLGFCAPPLEELPQPPPKRSRKGNRRNQQINQEKNIQETRLPVDENPECEVGEMCGDSVDENTSGVESNTQKLKIGEQAPTDMKKSVH